MYRTTPLRKVKKEGKFYTPLWIVKIARNYISESLEPDWTDNYTVWDCAAGSGNLFAEMEQKNNFFASSIDENEIILMKERSSNGEIGVPPQNIFQYDFINGNFMSSDLPECIAQAKKPFLFFVNPPYLSDGGLDISTKFLLRMRHEFKNCIIACFTKPLWCMPASKKFNEEFECSPICKHFYHGLSFNSKEF
ncbi:MAG: N-6 DNA methylase, partial [Prevotellaceae bacterium]|nr:N-6 DNA methylase [Prevotellaceae bacterium]